MIATQHTPLHVQILLHYYTSPEPYGQHEPAHAVSEAVHKFTNQLASERMIEATTEFNSGYRVTDKGEAWISAILNIPFPEAKWVIP